ncbi:epoxide hydrolase family protein [Cystobacter ferrugineus]|uniref:Epoxide hydrolase n=1 Tax=Cystobacter ferrugineus TaxID=83449 RepID=A0A1L9BJN4_9BACT|nr:epoxide hydrolase family protein [Cystobacter ferrugineus]OJH42512.1 epoxide hydrolase [Cystobacter ferrugineus]
METTKIDPRPYTVAVPDAVLEDLRTRLERTRLTDTVEGGGWDWGMDPDALRTLLDHWRGFDWRAAEAAINAVPAFRAKLDGLGLHFVHVRGEGERRLPILLTNGWPSCFTECLPLVPLLTREVDGLSFDVVIPSLPGYGFSDRPRAPGMNITRIAGLWAKLMAGLGYDRFLAHGSDMGAGVVERLRANHAGQLLGIHMVNVNWFYPPPDGLSSEEKDYLQRARQWQMREGAYSMLHGSKPRTIAVGLNDSPAGLAAWIGEKFHGWTDGGGRLDGAVSLDALCTVLTIYWVTGTIGSSQWLYREAFTDAGVMSPPPKQGVPVGVAIFPKDILPAPRAWGERWLDIQRWTELPRGGHFPGFETPELLAGDIRGFAKELGA